MKHAEGMSLRYDSLFVWGAFRWRRFAICVWRALDEELLEDFGGAEGTEGGVVEAVVGEDGVEHLVAFLAVETEDVEVAERHSRQQIDHLRLFGAQIMPTRRRARVECSVHHVEPIALLVVAHVGLDAEKTAQMIEEADVEVCHAVGHGVEQLHRSGDVLIQRIVLLTFLNGVREEFADKHGDGVFRRVGVEAVERVGAPHIVQRAQILPWHDARLKLQQPQRHKHSRTHSGSGGVALRHQKRHAPTSVGVDVGDVVAVVIFNSVEHYSVERFIHAVRLFCGVPTPVFFTKLVKMWQIKQ